MNDEQKRCAECESIKSSDWYYVIGPGMVKTCYCAECGWEKFFKEMNND